MEQKKTLWIIAAVGAFLLVVIGAAAIMYSPAKAPTPAIASVSPVAKVSTSSGWTNSQPIAIPDSVTTKANEVVVLADNATVYDMQSKDSTTIDLNSLKQETALEAQPQNINITVNIPEVSSKEATEKVTVTPSEVRNESKPVVKTEPVKAVSTPAVKTVTKTTTKATTKTTSAAPAPKAEPKKTQFWVQVAAYSNKKGAEGARSVLDANKIPADIFTYKDNKDKLFYRVRVGPYTTKSEAEYWRTRIIKIDEFSKAESYVTSTTN